MQWIIRFLLQHINASSLALAIILSFAMINANLPTQRTVIRSLSVSIFLPLQMPLSQFLRLRDVFFENSRLRSEAASLRLRCANLEEEHAENSRLCKLLDIREKESTALVAARVIARDPAPLFSSVVIDAGKDKGIELYMPVIAGAGVVGKVAQVLAHTSIVQLLRDPAERISVQIAHSGEVGILQTRDGSSHFVNFRQHAKVKIGDTITTSGYGGIYPRGLSVGRVSSIVADRVGLFKDVYVMPSADFDHFDELFVMKLTPSWKLYRDQIDSTELHN